MSKPSEIEAKNTELSGDEIKAMKTQSLLVAREVKKPRPGWTEEEGLNFSWIPRRQAFPKFLQLCKSQPIDLSISELYELQVICDEWECPKIEASVTSFLKRTQTGEQLFERFCEQQFQPRGLRKLVACHFAELANLTGVFRLTPKVLLQIMNEEECRFPPQNRLCELVGVFLHKYGRQAAGLVRFLDFRALDLERAVPIYNTLDELDVTSLFPNVRVIVKERLMRQQDEEVDRTRRGLRIETIANVQGNEGLRSIDEMNRANQQLEAELKRVKEEKEKAKKQIEKMEEERRKMIDSQRKCLKDLEMKLESLKNETKKAEGEYDKAQKSFEDKKECEAKLSGELANINEKSRDEVILGKNKEYLQQLEQAKRDYLEAADEHKKKTGYFADPPEVYRYDMDKRERKPPVIAVHSGRFHADDALAVYLLKETDRYKDADIVRTRDPKLIAQCDIVCDVGDVYDHARGRYDHHQQGFKTSFPGSQIPSAACGLVYYHYGREVIQKLITENKWLPSLEKNVIDKVWKLHYKFFVEELDAQDNGVKMAKGKPKYHLNTAVAARIGRLNFCNPSTDEVKYKHFLQAVELMGKEFRFFLKYLCCVKLPLRTLVRKAFKDMGDTHIMDLGYSPRRIRFHEELMETERKFQKEGEVLYVITKRDSGNGGKEGSDEDRFRWVVNAANRKESMEPRKALPFAKLELAEQRRLCEEKCGINDLEFLHKTGFMAAFKSEKSAREFAKYAVGVDDNEK